MLLLFFDRKKLRVGGVWYYLFIHGAITTHPDLRHLEWALSALRRLQKENKKLVSKMSLDYLKIYEFLPSPCISDVQRVKLSLNNCIISVESL